MSNSELRLFDHFQAVVTAHFPKGKHRCAFCTFYDERSYRCNITQTRCFYPREYMNEDCPLVQIEEEGE